MNDVIEQLRFLSNEETTKVAKDILPGLRASMSVSGSHRSIVLNPEGKHEIKSVLDVYDSGISTEIMVVTESINWSDFRRNAALQIQRMSIEDYKRLRKS